MANKEFDNVQLFAEYDSTVGSNVVNVFGNKSKENIAYSLSKIKNWFPWLVPTNGSTGQILEWYNNVPTWRANTNADTVKQTHSTDTDFHPLVLGAPHSASAWDDDDPISETTDQVYMNKGIYVKPSTSTIYATAFVGKVTHPTIPGTGADTTSSVTPLHGQGFTTVDAVTRDSNGHVTGINTKTVTLPAQYVHPTYTRTDTASTASPAHGGTFTAIDSVTSTNGHVTAVNLKTVTLPAQYVHPTYIDKTTADFYKIKITNGHISEATAIAKGDVSTFLNLLDTGSSTPTDADYYISQYVGGGTTTTSYHRRPMSALWSYVKGKADSIYAPLNHTHAYTVPVGITVKTGSSDQSHITLQTLMNWLITTKGYITSNTARSLSLYTSWSYAGNDILQLTIDGTAYELQLAGVIIEFDGYASDYQTGTFRLRIHSSPTVSFTPASGYTQFPASHIAEYTCNGSGYSPTWKMLVDKGDTVTRTGGGASGTWGISISGSAAKLGTANKGSPTKGIYLSGGTPQEMTYSLGSTVNGGTANCIAYYSGANAISSAAKVTYVNANNSASTPATVAGLHIESPTYGNTAANMIGGVAGVFSYGDGGPQIRFKDASSTQAGALIFTADDAAAAGTSWHFVSNETDWNVISKRFHAKTSISIGTDKPSTSYNLTVNGTSYFDNTITVKGTSSGYGMITYASYGNTRNAYAIKFYDGDVNGHGVQIGGGGLTVVGGGESAQTVFNSLSTLGLDAASENTIISADSTIYMMTCLDQGIANRQTFTFNTAGDFDAPRYSNAYYFKMKYTTTEDSSFDSNSVMIYSNSDGYFRRGSLSKLGSTLGPYVGPYVTNVSDGSVIHQNNFNSAGWSRPVHRFIRSLRTNKLAFTLPANITMEYSTNAGSSWTSFGYTDAQKAGPFISRHFGGSIAIGPTSGERTTSMQTRITITNDGRDCFIDQFYIWMSTSDHGTTVDIQYTTQSAKTTWVDWRTGVELAGWSGPNVINVSELRYGNTIYNIRFTFKITSVSSGYKTQPGTIYDIQAYGAMACWTSKNNMMTHDSLFTWDYEQKATFPAEVKIPTQLRIYYGNYGTLLRSDGSDTYFLVTDSGSAESGLWNSLRPFKFSNSTGYVTMGNGASIMSSSYGALSVIRSGSGNAGIKFYNNGSTYLGSLALGTANGTFVRFKTDESTAYTIIDTSLLNVTESTNLGLDGGTNAFGYVSGLTKAAWNFQQTDGTIIRQYYNANWKTEIFMDYRTGQMSSRGKNNGTWQDWRIHLDASNYINYATNNLGALNSTLGNGSPASATKTFFDTTTVPALNVSTGYNSSGAEYGFLFAKGGNNNYGTVLRWGYNSLYLEILRKQGGTWKSTDWEKISAGSADYVKVVAKNEIRFLNESGQFDYTNPYQFWFGFAWASGSISGTHLISTYIMGNCSGSGSGDNIATVTAKGFVSKTTSGGAGCTMQYNSSTQSLDFVFS